MVAGWSLNLKWTAARVCGCARALLVGGGEASVERLGRGTGREVRKRHDKVLSDCMHSLLE